jgi:CBS domain containing-hemolysin-like protein
MTNLSVAGICLVLALLMSMLRKAYFSLPAYELKRRAVSGDKIYSKLYPAVANRSLRGLLWLLMTALAAAFLVLVSLSVNLGLAIVVAVIWIWLLYSWLPNRRTSSIDYRLAALTAPFFIWLFNWAHPALKYLERVQKRYNEIHTGVYEYQDLRGFLRIQAQQPDNRISPQQLSRLAKLVAFEEAKVNHFFKPWKATIKLAESDIVGPKLLDEMHRSKQLSFAVTKQRNSHQICGVLSRDVVGLSSEGRVSDYMRSDFATIGRDDSMEDALLSFAHSSVPLLIVLDKESEAVGTLSLKDALDALLVLDKPAVVNKAEVPAEIDNQVEVEGELSQA